MKKAFSFLLLIISFEVFSSSIDDAIVDVIHIKQSNGYALIKTDKTPEDQISCAVNTSWDYSLPLTNEIQTMQLSALLTAYASKAKVKLSGLSACNEHSDVESLDMVRLQ